MRTIEVDGHTFIPELTRNGWIIDAGCRGFKLSASFACQKVYSLDVEDFTYNNIPPNTRFKHAALMANAGEVEAHYFGNGTGNFIKGLNGIPYNGPDRPCETLKVQSITLQEIYNEIGTNIDLLKLDIEGSEYEILANLEPVPKQVTVEMHEHCHTDLHHRWIDRVLKNMSKHYEMRLYTPESRYQYLDCLFIRKDLL